MNIGRFWLAQRVRDELELYGVLGTYYLLREDKGFFETVYVMWVAHRMNKHRAKNEQSTTVGVRVPPNLQ